MIFPIRRILTRIKPFEIGFHVFFCKNIEIETFMCNPHAIERGKKISITFNPFGGLKHLLCGFHIPFKTHSNDGFIDFFPPICCSKRLCHFDAKIMLHTFFLCVCVCGQPLVCRPAVHVCVHVCLCILGIGKEIFL